ncbi:MarR family winged helix-turn-helix transcriptional regulator [Frankia sp. AgPm24]|uniref:MarR family winged helix-turn-helix transcriptional regulator n=1 Tax=Frankia sp. AgPm24 TaxID=631128 RepID=UPI00200F59EB|nr:MarR family winged helix-turn-helix transcriptional regulator [Frankia sp. AgPm24]MCK9921243.1 MarR family winged helix-turn-helix transcriptional regulator [Frankia sp. AgPm24]
MTNDPDTELRQDLIERLRLLGEIDSTQTALFHQRAAATYGLGVTDMKALSILLRDGPQTAGSLMSQLAVTSGAVTGVINRLIAQHLAHRQSDPHDKRKVVVTVDLAGLAARDNVYLGIGAAFDRLHATYTTDQLRFLIRHLETAIEITRARTAALHPSADPPTRGPRRHP